MTIDRELLLRLAAQRAGLTEGQLDALRRHDYGALLEQAASPPPPGTDWPDDAADDSVGDASLDASLGAAVQPRAGTRPDADLVRLEADLARVSDRLAAVRRQRDAALGLLRQLAGRLGCCPHCWGTDATCAYCQGLGTPGHFTPDPRLREWLGPALASGGLTAPEHVTSSDAGSLADISAR